LKQLERGTGPGRGKTLDIVSNVSEYKEVLEENGINYKAAEVKVRAERKAGEMLGQLERPEQHRPNKHYQADNVFQEVITEQKIPQASAYRWQQVAEMPEDVFEAHLHCVLPFQEFLRPCDAQEGLSTYALTQYFGTRGIALAGLSDAFTLSRKTRNSRSLFPVRSPLHNLIDDLRVRGSRH
jgi:hypothetical protein